MIRRVLRHEVGHMFGLPARNHHVEENLGSHCTNICTMRQGISTPEWAGLTQEENRRGIHFCSDCLADFAKLQTRYRSLSPNK